MPHTMGRALWDNPLKENLPANLTAPLLSEWLTIPPGAKEKLGLRVHGLIVGSPEKKRADPAVLRSLCSQLLPNGKMEVLLA